MSTEQEDDFAFYGIIPGPVHNNFDVCDKSCYVATFEYVTKERVSSVDLYVITYKGGALDGQQSVLHRQDASWEGSYGSMPLEAFLQTLHVSDLNAQAFKVLLKKGKLTYTKSC